MAAGLPLMKNLLTPFAKTILMLSRLMTEASETDAAIQKNILESKTTAFITSEENIDDIIKIVKSFVISGLLLAKQLSKRIKSQTSWYVIRYVGV